MFLHPWPQLQPFLGIGIEAACPTSGTCAPLLSVKVFLNGDVVSACICGLDQGGHF